MEHQSGTSPRPSSAVKLKPGGKPSFRRRQLIVNPGFQYRLIGYGLGAAGLIIASLYVAGLYFFHRFEAMGVEMHFPADHVYFEFIRQQKDFTLKIFGALSVAVLGIMAFGCVILSHRIAGPIFRICRQMHDVAEGRTRHDARLRDGDFFQELAESLNYLMKSYRELESAKNEKKGA